MLNSTLIKYANDNLGIGASSQIVKKYGIGWYIMLLDKFEKEKEKEK